MGHKNIPVFTHYMAFRGISQPFPGKSGAKSGSPAGYSAGHKTAGTAAVINSLPSHYGSPISASPSVHDQPADPPALISGTTEFPARSTIAGLLFFVDGKFLTRITIANLLSLSDGKFSARIAIANLLSLSDGKFSARITIANLLSLFDGKFPT